MSKVSLSHIVRELIEPYSTIVECYSDGDRGILGQCLTLSIGKETESRREIESFPIAEIDIAYKDGRVQVTRYSWERNRSNTNAWGNPSRGPLPLPDAFLVSLPQNH